MADKIKLLVAFLFIAAGVVGFYALGDAAAVLRVASVLFGVLAAAGVFWTSSQGKRFFGFAGTLLPRPSAWYGRHVKRPCRPPVW